MFAGYLFLFYSLMMVVPDFNSGGDISPVKGLLVFKQYF